LEQRSSGPQLVKNFPSLCWTQGSLPPVTYYYPKPNQSSPCLPIPLLENICKYYSYNHA